MSHIATSPFDVFQPETPAEPSPAFPVSKTGALPNGASAQFATDGVVCLPGALSPEHVETLRTAVDDAVASPGPHSYRVSTPDDPGFFFTDYNLHQRDPQVAAIIHDGPVADLARQLVGSVGMTLYFDNIFVKAAGSRNIVPWHLDAMYLRMNGTVLNCWIALDPVPESSAVLFKRGSHLRDEPTYEALHFDPSRRYASPLKDGRVPMPDFADLDQRFDSIWWRACPGDLVVFHQQTLHASLPNTAAHTRRAIGFLLLADDVTYNADPADSDPPFRGENLVDGGAPQCESFPRLR